LFNKTEVYLPIIPGVPLAIFPADIDTNFGNPAQPGINLFVGAILRGPIEGPVDPSPTKRLKIESTDKEQKRINDGLFSLTRRKERDAMSSHYLRGSPQGYNIWVGNV